LVRCLSEVDVVVVVVVECRMKMEDEAGRRELYGGEGSRRKAREWEGVAAVA